MKKKRRKFIFRILPTEDHLEVEWLMYGCNKTTHCCFIFYEDMDAEFRSIIPKEQFHECFLDHHLDYLHWRSKDGYLISRDPRKIDYTSGCVKKYRK